MSKLYTEVKTGGRQPARRAAQPDGDTAMRSGAFIQASILRLCL